MFEVSLVFFGDSKPRQSRYHLSYIIDDQQIKVGMTKVELALPQRACPVEESVQREWIVE